MNKKKKRKWGGRRSGGGEGGAYGMDCGHYKSPLPNVLNSSTFWKGEKRGGKRERGEKRGRPNLATDKSISDVPLLQPPSIGEGKEEGRERRNTSWGLIHLSQQTQTVRSPSNLYHD